MPASDVDERHFDLGSGSFDSPERSRFDDVLNS